MSDTKIQDFMTQNIFETKTMSLQEAFNEIHFYRGVSPTKAYEVLINQQHESTPRLLQLLKEAIERHDRTGDYYVAHIHALLLLSQFKEKKAYPLVIELLNLPIDSIDRLIADMLTETIPKIIASIYDGNPEPLFAILVNKETNEFVRAIIASCFTALIYQNLINKEMVTLKLQEIVARGEMNQDQVFFTALVNITMDCKLEPLYDTARAAFKAGMVCKDLMGIGCFEKSLPLPIEKLKEKEYLSPITDALKELKEWGDYAGDVLLAVKIERNASCPCGSGQKFKKCCITHV